MAACFLSWSSFAEGACGLPAGLLFVSIPLKFSILDSVFMKNIYFLWAGLLFSGGLLAQESPLIIKDRLEKISSAVAGGPTIEGFDNRVAGVKGSPYLYDDWLSGKVIFMNGQSMENILLNFDLHNKLLEVKMRHVVKVGKPEDIEAVEVSYGPAEIRRFIPVSIYETEKKEPAEGFAQVLYDGNIQLLKQTALVIYKPNYRPSHDVGSQDIEIRKKEQLYLLEGGILKAVKRSPDFGKWTKEVKAYSKEHKLRAKNEEDLIRMVRFYDSLL